MKNYTITVLGEGAWGTALASTLADNGHAVRLWCHDAAIADEIMSRRTNTRYMPQVCIADTIFATADIHDAVCNTDMIYEAIPVQYLRAVVTMLRSDNIAQVPWVVTSKGIEQDTLLLPAEVITEGLGYTAAYAVCTGPSFARELITKQLTGIVVAAEQLAVQALVASSLHNTYITCDLSTDTHGLQICAAFKNVVALLVGIADGKSYGDNTRALLVARCFQHMSALVVAAGGCIETAQGLGGFGDLFLTATSKQSRNYSVGFALGQGEALAHIIERTGFTPEGVNTARSIIAYAARYGVDLHTIMSLFPADMLQV